MSPKATIIVICILSLVLGSTKSQTSSEIDVILNERKSCGLNKKCVPNNLCDENGKLIRSGKFSIEDQYKIVNIREQGVCSYLEVCCNVGNKMTKPEPIPTGPKGCGYRNPNGVGFSITGYKPGESQFGEFPWMVAILRVKVINCETFKFFKCGGAVITPNVVLTAAHCLEDLEPQNLIARAGEWDTRTENEALPHQDARVKEIIRHEQFHKRWFSNDVALLILETPCNWTGNVRPICLPEPNTHFDYSRCYATRWDKDKFSDDDIYYLIMKKSELPTVPHGTCQAQLRRSSLGKSYNLDPSLMCADDGTDMCTFVKGYPLVCPDPRNPERYYLAGITSWCINFGEGSFPGVFASVPYLRNWINEKQVGQKGPNFNHMLDLIFDNNTSISEEDTTTETPVNSCGIDKECVPRALCNTDGNIKTFGQDMIDLRMDFGNPCTYLEKCCNVKQKLTQAPPAPVPNVQEIGCGIRNANGVLFKIMGAESSEAEFGEFPWMVAILTLQGGATIYHCGGSLIAPNAVLTAAHCVLNQPASQLIARAGEWDTETNQEPLPHQDAQIKEIIIHEDYNPTTIFNDIALLILETPVTWAGNVQPVCLPDANTNFDHSRCFATGWGKDKYGKDGLYQLILKKIELPVVPHATCQANLRRTRLSRFFQLDKSFMCAGGEKDKDTCKGDGGSPLVCPDPKNPERYFQAGIVSWGVRCGEENIPGVYANVPYLRSWIDGKLAAGGVDLRQFTD